MRHETVHIIKLTNQFMYYFHKIYVSNDIEVKSNILLARLPRPNDFPEKDNYLRNEPRKDTNLSLTNTRSG